MTTGNTTTQNRGSVPSHFASVPAIGVCPFADAVRTHVGRTVVGQQVVVERVMIALLTGGHLLLEGVPGIAKTLIVQSVAKAIDLKFSRVQFTIDLLPSDILGSEILDQKQASSGFTVVLFSQTFCWLTKSIGPRLKCSRRCLKPCKNARFPLEIPRMFCPRHSW